MQNATYDFNEHKHRYALWTAARAVQRSFTTTDRICAALNDTFIRAFTESEQPVSQTEFDRMHSDWCIKLMAHFKEGKPACSFGRAAKMVAIYLKTSLVLPTRGQGANATVVHPPIDRILLHRLAVAVDLPALRSESWTAFDEPRYNAVKEMIVAKTNCFNWRLESHWECADVSVNEEAEAENFASSLR